MPTPARGTGRSTRSRVSQGPGRGRTAARTSGRRTGTAKSAQQPPQEPPPRARLTGRSALLFVVLAVLVVSYASSMRAWLEQRAHIQDLQSQIAADKRTVDELAEEKHRWKDPAYVKAQARERFGWVLPGEVGYRVIDENGEPLGVTSELTDPESSAAEAPAWWERAWGTVVEAGAEPSDDTGDEPARFIGPQGRSR